MADFDAAPPLDTSRPPGVRAFRAPHAPASSFEVSREALAAKAFPPTPSSAPRREPRDEAPACRVGDAAERRLAARLARTQGPGPPACVRAPLGGRPSDSLGGRPVSRADALDTVHNLDDMLMAALAASRPWSTFVDALEERAPASAEPRVFERAEPRPRPFFSRSSATFLAERTECDATVMSVGEVSGPSAYARVADDVVRQALSGRRGASARSPAAPAAPRGRARVAAAARAVQDTLVLEPAWARFVDAEDAFRRSRAGATTPPRASPAPPRDVRVAAAKAARKRVVAPRGAILDAARGAHAASVSWLKSHEREARAYSEDEDEDVGFATPRASAPGSPSTQDETQEEADDDDDDDGADAPHGFPIDIFHRTNPVVPYKNRSVVPKESAQFPTKLRALLEEPKHADVVVWRASTQSICVLDKPAFCKILPRYFKLSYKTGAAAADLKKMWDSFVRQLNYYGFHKRTRAPTTTSTGPPCPRAPPARAAGAGAGAPASPGPAASPAPSKPSKPAAPSAPSSANKRKRKASARRPRPSSTSSTATATTTSRLRRRRRRRRGAPSRLPPKKRKRRG
ncbi:hypothetical protein JL720_11648 [Aureococcus anophagefferens]|nr:hypothetical protein JL720_11648 [Aureococcus anophagefferens]